MDELIRIVTNKQKMLTILFSIYLLKIALDDWRHREVWLWDLMILGLCCNIKIYYHLIQLPWIIILYFLIILLIYGGFLFLLIYRTQWLTYADGYVLVLIIMMIIMDRSICSYEIILHFLSQWILYSIAYMIHKDKYSSFPALSSFSASWFLILWVFGLDCY